MSMPVLMSSFLNLGPTQYLLAYRKSVINRKLGTQFKGDTQKGLFSHFYMA